MSLLWQFEGGEAQECPLQALESAVGSKLILPVEIDCEDVLRLFARQCALDVIHTWDAPDVVREYLETGKESLRTAAGSAARDAARDAVRDAAGSAARSAARSAAMGAAMGAAGSAARDAARSAARSAARDAAGSAARDAAGSAARDAAGSPASNTARSAMWDAVRSPENDAASAAAWYAAWDAGLEKSRAKQSQHLTTLLAAHICPVPEDLTARLEEHRRIQYEQPELVPLYLGTWWDKGLEGLDLIET